MKKRNNIYVDFHVLQTLPPSCVNRDDTGSPKTAVYGGVTRARVSSQAWKRAVRMMFQDIFPTEQVGIRSKQIPDLIKKELLSLEPAMDEKKAGKLAQEALKNGGISVKEEKADALFFISMAQIKALARVALSGATQKDVYKKALNDNPSIDIALFGRMVASDPSLNYDAAAQVAHAISTHAIHNEYDYFTAVDDCSKEDNAGAGHLGTVEFNSATMYRYATVNVKELRMHLGDDAVNALAGFAQAFICSMPTGKQNTFANRTVPDAVYVAVRQDQPVNLAGAFERPVRAGEEGYVEKSIERLASYAGQVYDCFVKAPQQAWTVGSGERLAELGRNIPLDEMLKELQMEIENLSNEVEV